MLEVRSQVQLRAVADPTRRRILSLLRERAASTTELAEALGQPKGTVGHHVKVLEDAKLIHLPHEAWGRAAFVTNHDVLGGIATAFGGLVPGEFSVFPLEKQREAVAWAAEGAQSHAR